MIRNEGKIKFVLDVVNFTSGKLNDNYNLNGN